MKLLCIAVLIVAAKAGPVMGPSLVEDLYFQEEVTRMLQDSQWKKSFEMMEAKSICDLCDYTWTNLTPFFAEYSKIYYKDGMVDEVFLSKGGTTDLYYVFLGCRDKINKQYPGAKDIEHVADIEKCYYRKKFNCGTM